MKLRAGFNHKRNYRINQFLRFFALFWAINCGMFNAGYCGTQSLELSHLFFCKIPFNQAGVFGECGNYISVSFFSALKSPRNQFCPSDLVSPAGHERQKSAPTVCNAANPLPVNVQPVRDNNGQHPAKRYNGDGLPSCQQRIDNLWQHLLSGFLGGFIALAIWQRIKR